jgi:hypothetical protein
MNHLKNTSFQSTEDQKILKKISLKNTIFREYDKIKDKYIATNKFYISCEVDDDKYEFNEFEIESFNIKNNIKFIPDPNNNNLYLIDNKNESINLILISNISFTLNEIQINKNDLLKKFINNDSNIDENIIEDIYYNDFFSKKIQLNIPNKYNNYLNNKDTIKKYLFKLNLIESNHIFYQADYKLFL